MAKQKAKAGRKKTVAKPASAPRARKAAPEKAQQAAPAVDYPCTVHVLKGAEKIPVQVKDAAHHERLKAEFGASSVEVLK